MMCLSAATQAQAVKPAVKPTFDVSEQESLQLTRNLLRIAMFNISYIRGLFPENYFSDKFVPALEMKVKKLMPLDMESKRFLDWMEKGVFDALQKKYLRTLFLTICGAQDGPMVEEYLFSFTYGAKGASKNTSSMTIECSNGKPVQTNTPNELTPQQMKRSACKMVRTLVQLMHTLDNVPQERTIIMKLHYYDDVTPWNYEPPFFTSTTYEDPNVWSRAPLKMKVGHVDSRHYRIAIKMKSIFDPCQDENDLAKSHASSGLIVTSEGTLSSDSDSEQITSQPSQPSQKTLAPTDAVKGAGVSQFSAATEATALANQLKNMRPTACAKDVDSDRTEDPQYEAESLRAIRQYLQRREDPSVEMTDILGEFPQISLVLVEELVERLVEEELLTKLKKDLFYIKRSQIGWKQAPKQMESAPQPHTPKIEPVNSGTNKSSAIPSPKDTNMLRSSKGEADEEDNEKQHLYKMALLHTLQLKHITMPQLQTALRGVGSGVLRELMAWMARDGFIENTPKNRRNGRQVLHSLETDKKLRELHAYFNLKDLRRDETEKQEHCNDMEISRPLSIPGQAVPLPEVLRTKVDSTFGCVQILGSEITRQEQSIGPDCSTANNRSKDTSIFKEPALPQLARQELSKQQLALSEQSANPQVSLTNHGATGKRPKVIEFDSPTDIVDSESPLHSFGHYRGLKASKVDGPIYQPPFKRVRSG